MNITQRNFKPAWVWGSWLANIGFFVGFFTPRSDRGARNRGMISMVSLLLGLSFLAVSEYQATGHTGDSLRSYWTEVRPANGYFVWLAALACMTGHCLKGLRSADGTPEGSAGATPV